MRHRGAQIKRTRHRRHAKERSGLKFSIKKSLSVITADGRRFRVAAKEGNLCKPVLSMLLCTDRRSIEMQKRRRNALKNC